MMQPATATNCSSRAQPAAGFTLIELMIVIAILGLLAAVLLPNILGAQDASNETDTESIFIQLDHAAGAFDRKHGIYPPANLKMPDKGSKLAKAVAKWKPDNGRNTGIESFVAFVSQDRRGGTDLSVLGDNLCNTDNDKHGAELTLLGRTERLEIADAWRTPMAYFDRFTMKKPQTMVSFKIGRAHV